jgi:hypothetical protein
MHKGANSCSVRRLQGHGLRDSIRNTTSESPGGSFSSINLVGYEIVILRVCIKNLRVKFNTRKGVCFQPLFFVEVFIPSVLEVQVSKTNILL